MKPEKNPFVQERNPVAVRPSTVNWRLCWGLYSQSPIFVTKFLTVKWVNSFFRKLKIIFLHLKVKTFSQNRAVILIVCCLFYCFPLLLFRNLHCILHHLLSPFYPHHPSVRL